MTNFTVVGKCPGCGKDFESVPTSWENHLPSACNCNHCGVDLSWPTNDPGIYWSKLEFLGMSKAEQPTFEVTITKEEEE